MKLFASILSGVCLALAASAGPFQKEHVAANAKWLIHLDVENLLATQIGEFLGKEIFDKQLAAKTREVERQFDIDLDWRKVRSLTAYGTDFKSSAQDKGVLLIESGLNLAASLDRIIEKAAESSNKERFFLKKVEGESFPLYAAENVFGTPAGQGLFLISKSKEELKKARQVLTGKAPNLAASRSFPAFAETPKGFLLVKVADGFSAASKLPSKVDALKNAEGGQIVAGERATNIFLNLSLNAKDTQSATQMQQVVQGLVALASLSQNENKDLQRIAQGIKVGGSEKTVTIDLEVPASDVIARVGDSRKRRDNN